MDATFLLLAFIVLVSQTVSTVAGFGANIITLALGAHLYPLEFLVPVVVPLNLLLNLYLVASHHGDIDRKTLKYRMLPFMCSGLLLGLTFFFLTPSQELKWFFGIFVLVIAARELAGLLLQKQNYCVQPLSLIKSALWLVSAGIIHGVYASGGPLLVYFASRQITDKSIFRSTLAALWLFLSIFLLVAYFWGGRVTPETLKITALLLPGLAAGVITGEYLHMRIEQRTFRIFIFILLFFAGVSLVAS